MPLFSKRELETLETIGRNAENINIAPLKLGVTSSAMNSTLTRIWKKICEADEVKKDYRTVFEGRIKIRNKRRIKK